MKNERRESSAGFALGVIMGAAAAVTAGVLGGIGNRLYNMVMKKGSKDVFMNDTRFNSGEDETSTQANEKAEEGYKLWLEEKAFEEAEIIAFDGLRLAGKIYKASGAETNKWVIAVHGYNATGENMRKPAFYFTKTMGINTLAVDCRGNGESQGGYIGMGWYDRLDIISWINYVISLDPSAEIILYGISMGASAVMMASGERLPENVKCVIEDCGYTSLWDEMVWQLERAYKISPFPALNAMDAICQVRAGFSIKEASAVRQIKKSRIPTLFIHGEEDRFVPYPMVFTLYQEMRGPKDIFTVPGAGHAKSSVVAPKAYWAKVEEFIGKYV